MREILLSVFDGVVLFHAVVMRYALCETMLGHANSSSVSVVVVDLTAHLCTAAAALAGRGKHQDCPDISRPRHVGVGTDRKARPGVPTCHCPLLLLHT